MAESTLTLRMPGSFDGWFDGTGIAQGQYDKEAATEVLVHDTYKAATAKSYGRNYVLQIVVAGSRETLREVLKYHMEMAEACIMANESGDRIPGQLAAARTWLERLRKAAKEFS